MRRSFTTRFLTAAIVLSSACIAKDADNLGMVDDDGADTAETDDPATTGGSSGGSASATTTTGNDPSATDGDDGATDGATVGDSGDPLTCDDPGSTFFEPASCSSKEPVPLLPESGCYEPCAGPGAACAVGECTEVQVEPCPCPPDAESCCGACSANEWLCVELPTDDYCEDIIGAIFQSVEELECGIKPGGVVLCNWTIDFDADGTFIWMFSDVGAGGNYTCEDGVLDVQGVGVDYNYDPMTQILTWDGVEYMRQP